VTTAEASKCEVTTFFSHYFGRKSRKEKVMAATTPEVSERKLMNFSSWLFGRKSGKETVMARTKKTVVATTTTQTEEGYRPDVLWVRWMIRRDMPLVVHIEQATSPHPLTDEEIIACMQERRMIGYVAERNHRIDGFSIIELGDQTLRILKLSSNAQDSAEVKNTLLAKSRSKLSRRRWRLAFPVPIEDKVQREFCKTADFVEGPVFQDYFGKGRHAVLFQHILPDIDNSVIRTALNDGIAACDQALEEITVCQMQVGYLAEPDTLADAARIFEQLAALRSANPQTREEMLDAISQAEYLRASLARLAACVFTEYHAWFKGQKNLLLQVVSNLYQARQLAADTAALCQKQREELDNKAIVSLQKRLEVVQRNIQRGDVGRAKIVLYKAMVSIQEIYGRQQQLPQPTVEIQIPAR
jgi:ribosomal-protein-alanine N-acetyltransferase